MSDNKRRKIEPMESIRDFKRMMEELTPYLPKREWIEVPPSEWKYIPDNVTVLPFR